MKGKERKGNKTEKDRRRYLKEKKAENCGDRGQRARKERGKLTGKRKGKKRRTRKD